LLFDREGGAGEEFVGAVDGRARDLVVQRLAVGGAGPETAGDDDQEEDERDDRVGDRQGPDADGDEVGDDHVIVVGADQRPEEQGRRGEENGGVLDGPSRTAGLACGGLGVVGGDDQTAEFLARRGAGEQLEDAVRDQQHAAPEQADDAEVVQRCEEVEEEVDEEKEVCDGGEEAQVEEECGDAWDEAGAFHGEGE
jgi:hypothetical protein